MKVNVVYKEGSRVFLNVADMAVVPGAIVLVNEVQQVIAVVPLANAMIVEAPERDTAILLHK